MNKLQLVHARDAVFYETYGREAELQILHEEIEDHRLDEYSHVMRFDGDGDRFPTDNEVIQFTRPIPDFFPTLSFVEPLEREFTPVRSPQLAELHEIVVDNVLGKARQQYEAETDDG